MQEKRKLNKAAIPWPSGTGKPNEMPKTEGYSPTWVVGYAGEGETSNISRNKNLDFRRRQMMTTKTHKKMSPETVGTVRERERERERERNLLNKGIESSHLNRYENKKEHAHLAKILSGAFVMPVFRIMIAQKKLWGKEMRENGHVSKYTKEESQMKMKRILVSMMFVTLCFFIVGCQKNTVHQPETGEIEGNTALIEGEKRIAHILKNATSEYQKKEFTISPFESGDIFINVNRTSGNIQIVITDEEREDITRELKFDLQNREIEEQVIHVAEGKGTYTLEITTTDFVGSYDISWIVENAEVYETYESAQGYALEYNPNKFITKTSEGSDYFLFSKVEMDQQEREEDENVYLAVSVIDSENVQAVRDSIFTPDVRIGYCILADGKLRGQFVQEESNSSADRITKRTFMVDLEDGKAMVLETSFYSKHQLEMGVDEKRIDSMLDSIVIK